MNERLQELAVQAKELAEQAFREDGAKRFTTMEKFAELIVRECARLIRAGDYSHTADPVFEASCDIEEHFGVEE